MRKNVVINKFVINGIYFKNQNKQTNKQKTLHARFVGIERFAMDNFRYSVEDCFFLNGLRIKTCLLPDKM